MSTNCEIKIDKLVVRTLCNTKYAGYNPRRIECIIEDKTNELRRNQYNLSHTFEDQVFFEYLKHANIK